MSITVDDMTVDAAGAGIRARDKARESLIADALVPVLIVRFIRASAASLKGFAFCFSLAASPVLIVSIASA